MSWKKKKKEQMEYFNLEVNSIFIMFDNSIIMSETEIENAVKTSKNENKVIGFFKYMYYISPFGWLCSRKQHDIAMLLTKHSLFE